MLHSDITHVTQQIHVRYKYTRISSAASEGTTCYKNIDGATFGYTPYLPLDTHFYNDYNLLHM